MKNTSIQNRIIWIILAFFGWYIVLGDTAVIGLDKLIRAIVPNPSPGLAFVLEYYAPLLASCVVFVIICALTRRNRFLLDIIKPTKEKQSMSHLGVGLLLGFLTNFFCIVCALIHGDIKLSPHFSASDIPLMLFALLCVFFQSTSEELWCRGFMMHRINVHYPLWVGIVVNSIVFGLLHSFNDGITALAMADLIICGLAYSLLCWYSGSILTCFGIHTMWNFTQNFIFGLPNSGLVSECSIFHLDAASGISNWIYSYEFGVEGAVPAVFIDILLAGVILYLAVKNGRIKELTLSRESQGLEPLPSPKKKPHQTVVVEADPAAEPIALQKAENEKYVEFDEE